MIAGENRIHGNFTPFQNEMTGLFLIFESSKKEERSIIGETEELYVEKLIWSEDEVGECLFPIGIEKKWFVRWQATQMELF